MSRGRCTLDEAESLYTIDDLADMHEMLSVQAENERRAHEALEKKFKAKG